MTQAGTHVLLSTKLEKTPFSMMSEYYVSKNTFHCGAIISHFDKEKGLSC